MPFQSEKQRKYLWANEPEIARDWTDKYGSRVKKQEGGGIMDAWGKHATATEAMKLMNQPDYHQKAGYNFMQNFPNTPQWLANTLATGYQYGSEGFKALKGGTDFSDAMARAKEEARLNRLGIQGLGFDMGEYENFMQNYNAANEISPAGLKSLVRPTPQAGQRRSGIPRRDTWNQYQLTKHGPFGGPFGYRGFTKDALDNQDFSMDNLIMGGEYVPEADLNKAYRLMMNEKMRSYGEHETIPNPDYYGLEIERNYTPTGEVPLQIGPYKGSRYATTDIKNIGTRVLTKEEYDNLNLDEDDPYVDRIRNRINTVSQPRGILAALRNRFYKPATMHTRDYTPAQLNRMNALGGQYSEPARRQRQDRTRVANLLARKAADKPYSQKNLNILTMGSRPGHYDRPGGGNGVQGTSTPSRSGGWHPGV
jgi:hypothetical protein